MIYKIDSPAKINLFLDVQKKREDGYHEIKTVMQKIDLHDSLFFNIKKQKTDNYLKNIKITSNKPYLPVNNKNLCYMAISYFKKEFNIRDEIHLNIVKRIPISAGLGGGSSNFYYTIKFLNDFYKLKLSTDDLIKISNLFGSDIAFFSKKFPCLCEGRGEILTEIPYNIKFNIKVITPQIKVSTKKIFELFDESLIIDHKKNITNILNGLKLGNIKLVVDNCFNSLEAITIKKHKIIQKIKETNMKNGAMLSLMSGSGPSVFSIY